MNIDLDLYWNRHVVVYTENRGPVFVGQFKGVECDSARLQPSIVESSDNPSNLATEAYITSHRYLTAMQRNLPTEVPCERVVGITDITSLLPEQSDLE